MQKTIMSKELKRVQESVRRIAADAVITTDNGQAFLIYESKVDVLTGTMIHHIEELGYRLRFVNSFDSKPRAGFELL